MNSAHRKTDPIQFWDVAIQDKTGSRVGLANRTKALHEYSTRQGKVEQDSRYMPFSAFHDRLFPAPRFGQIMLAPSTFGRMPRFSTKGSAGVCAGRGVWSNCSGTSRFYYFATFLTKLPFFFSNLSLSHLTS
jgi:hypothetical protein